MKYIEFAEELKKAIEQRTGKHLRVETFKRSTGEYTGLVETGVRCSAVINLDIFFNRSLEGWGMDELVEMAVAALKSTPGLELDRLNDYQNVDVHDHGRGVPHEFSSL